MYDYWIRYISTTCFIVRNKTIMEHVYDYSLTIYTRAHIITNTLSLPRLNWKEGFPSFQAWPRDVGRFTALTKTPPPWWYCLFIWLTHSQNNTSLVEIWFYFFVLYDVIQNIIVTVDIAYANYIEANSFVLSESCVFMRTCNALVTQVWRMSIYFDWIVGHSFEGVRIIQWKSWLTPETLSFHSNWIGVDSGLI